MIRALLVLLSLAAPGHVAAQGADLCRSVEHRGQAFTVCSVDLDRYRADLHLRDAEGRILGSFAAMEAAHGPALVAMNAGMYHRDRSPVGLYREEGRDVAPLVTSAGPGNFGMLPNGVLCLGDGEARVVESRRYAEESLACRDATQSGPMLLIDGEVHPRFIEDSPYRNVRNGAGASPDGRTLHLVISDGAVTFHEIATLFRDELGVRDALYLDGKISRLHAGGRSDVGWPMGPMIAVRAR
ncbi:phosphodiester glycosidase family protein [Jannaschia sp. W003]|uniref:phosphodiester glycosidase family protein n=1 Tax=Jannaschia sp. W003 TaxID=2867012 RepID=UPI0021A88E56|nr:phosphodiester glycosidase family protein [Jannaschia sp. W003]UWQ21428.1 phosphodiester glycosidase family protein [Jannaschia sp. W003]